MAGEKTNVSTIILRISIRVLINVLLLFVLVQGMASAYQFSYKLFGDIPYVAASNTQMKITIPEGSGVMDIATLLEQNGVVDSRYLFLCRVYIGEYRNKLLAGTYTLGPGMSPDEICQTICGIQSEEDKS